MEDAILVSLEKGRPIFIGHEKRNIAEHTGLCHLTSIIILGCGDKLIVHNRRMKQMLKGKACPEFSYNFVGGHAVFTEDCGLTKNTPIPPDFIDSFAKRELSEEFLIPCAKEEASLELDMYEIYNNELKFTGLRYAKPIDLSAVDLTFLGYSVYSSPYNNEISAVYFLRVPEEDLNRYVFADDFDFGGSKHNVLLPSEPFTLSELREMSDSLTLDNIEICDAIKRIFLYENAFIAEKLAELLGVPHVELICDHDWEDSDTGTFACSGKVATMRCKKCGETHRYYSDTGTIID